MSDSEPDYDECNKDFLNFCKTGELDKITPLLSFNINIMEGMLISSMNNHVEILNYLQKTFKLDIYEYDEFNFANICHTNHIDIVGWFLDNYDISESIFDQAFHECAIDGHLEIGKMLLYYYLEQYDKWLHIAYNILPDACANNHTDFVEWLLTFKIKVRDFDEVSFTNACLNNNIIMVKMLLEKDPLIDIHVNNDAVFKICDKRKYSDLLNLLQIY